MFIEPQQLMGSRPPRAPARIASSFRKPPGMLGWNAGGALGRVEAFYQRKIRQQRGKYSAAPEARVVTRQGDHTRS